MSKRLDYISWEDYFMGIAMASAQRSKDPCTQVGACIVNSDRKIVATGYNGMPCGCNDDLMPWGKVGTSILDTKYPYVCHAEMNAIMNKHAASVVGATMFVTLFPCNQCAQLIIQSRIAAIVYLEDRDKPDYDAARRLFDMSGVTYRYD
ncbi:unnamed protein product [Soboliphyme baturini]|uniref:Probable deoxycytidylate deaminase n=1 Tax=Soboliphyme baturini TaxID=241478 RepID=A0A183IGT5_9BILA|nr:unnamed protein product [Soboliphyme baturini]